MTSIHICMTERGRIDHDGHPLRGHLPTNAAKLSDRCGHGDARR